MHRRFSLIAGAALLCAGSEMAFTDGPVERVVPASAGGTIDVTARALGIGFN